MVAMASSYATRAFHNSCSTGVRLYPQWDNQTPLAGRHPDGTEIDFHERVGHQCSQVGFSDRHRQAPHTSSDRRLREAMRWPYRRWVGEQNHSHMALITQGEARSQKEREGRFNWR